MRLTNQIRFRIKKSNLDMLERIADGSGLDKGDVANVLLASACQAIIDAGGNLTLPLVFVVKPPK